MDKLVYSVKDIAKILNLGMNKTYDLIHENVIPHIKLGRKIIIPKKAFDIWLTNCVEAS